MKRRCPSKYASTFVVGLLSLLTGIQVARADTVLANNSGIVYSPATSDSDVWTDDSVGNDNDNLGVVDIFRTASLSAKASFTFAGSGLKLFLSSSTPSMIASLNITIDNQSMTASGDVMERLNDHNTLWAYSPQVSNSFDAQSSHSVDLERAFLGSSNYTLDWALVGYQFDAPSETTFSISSLSVTLATSTPTATAQTGESVSAGIVAGSVVGALFALGLLGGFLLCCTRRRRKSNLEPDPLVIVPQKTQAPSNLPGARLFPLFRAPTSVWPTSRSRSTIELDMSERAHQNNIDRDGNKKRLASPTRYLPPTSVPPRIQGRRHSIGSFFVANPSSHSSSDRSIRSLSLINIRPTKRNIPPPIPFSLKPANSREPEKRLFQDFSGTNKVQLPKVAKVLEKQRGVDFEIESQAPLARPPERSFRRRFFTTNPNPTASTTSSSSSKAKASEAAKKAADFVRSHVRQFHQTERTNTPRKLPAIPQNPPTMTQRLDTHASRPLNAVRVSAFPSGPRTREENVASHPRRRHEGPKVFFTTNPNPSTINIDDRLERPRVDKGKRRAD